MSKFFDDLLQSKQKEITVKQTRSGNGRAKNQQETLRSLQLGKIGKEVTVPINSCTVGMLKTVEHLINVVEQN